jgi:hypothetical protein
MRKTAGHHAAARSSNPKEIRKDRTSNRELLDRYQHYPPPSVCSAKPSPQRNRRYQSITEAAGNVARSSNV